MTSEEEKRIDDFITGNYWKNAKTYEKTAPHSYALKAMAPEDIKQDFAFMAEMIVKYGIEERFFSKYYKYLHFKGHKYWSMDKILAETDLINRATI